MEKQPEQMLCNTVKRIENYPELKSNIEPNLAQAERVEAGHNAAVSPA